MSSLIPTPQIQLSEAEASAITGIEAFDLRKYQPDGFGMPGHWFLNKHSVFVYTDKGLAQLANGLEAGGQEVAVVCLRAKLTELRDTPSRSLIPAKEKGLYYQRGDLA